VILALRVGRFYRLRSCRVMLSYAEVNDETVCYCEADVHLPYFLETSEWASFAKCYQRLSSCVQYIVRENYCSSALRYIIRCGSGPRHSIFKKRKTHLKLKFFMFMIF